MGMFLADNGALGIKTRATFRLVRRPVESRHLSFAFDTYGELYSLRWQRWRARRSCRSVLRLIPGFRRSV